VCDEWFVDDGQALVQPALVEPFLRCLDKALAEVGATRGEGPEIKSTARLLCPLPLTDTVSGWDTEYVRRTCKVKAANSASEVLGATLGDKVAATTNAKKVVKKVAELRHCLAGLDHVATELVLTRRCADVAKLGYALRCSGDRLDKDVLEEFDKDLRSSLETTLGGSLRDTAWWQASTGVRSGGLGLREAVAVALPAVLASRITSRPLAMEMAAHAAAAGLVTVDQFTAAYDQRTRDALLRLRADLPDEVADEVKQGAEDGTAAAAARWQTLQQGEQSSAATRGAGRRPGHGLVLEAGEEDPESPDTTGRTGPGLQAQFTSIVDTCIQAGLEIVHNEAESLSDVRRLKDLADPHCNHDWLWALCCNHGPTLQDEEFVEAVRLRLGDGGPSEPVACRSCKDGLLDTSGSHALCCALGEATRGHNAVRNSLHETTKSGDSSAETEPLGLIPSVATLRPADVFTSAAAPGRLSALDVGICSPEAADVGADRTESTKLRRLPDFAPHLSALERQSIVYTPVNWSCFGRPHSAITAALRNMCRQAARR